MKRKILSTLFALVLACSLSLVMAVPASADVTSATVAVVPTTAGEVDAEYTITFNVGAAGALVTAESDTIEIVFPAGTVVDEGGGAITGTVNTVAIVTATGVAATRTVTITTPVDVANDGEVVVVLATGITNPEAAGGCTLTVATNEEPAAIVSQTYTITAGALEEYLVEPEAGTYTAGAAFDVVITAVDQFDNPLGTAYATDEPYTWETTADDAPDGTAPEIGTLAAIDFTDGVATKSVTLYAAEPGVTFTVTDTSLETGTSTGITVDHEALAAYTVVPATLIEEIGTAFDVTITAVDDYENPLGSDYGDPGDVYTWTSTASNAIDGTEPDIGTTPIFGDFGGDGDVIISVTLVYAEAGVTFTLTDSNTITGTSPGVFVEGTNLDKVFYSIGDNVAVTVLDDGANVDPIRTETVDVTATSTTDAVGITVTLSETGVDTGIFIETFPLVAADPEPGPGELAVADGDTITVVAVAVPDASATVDMSDPVFDTDTTPDADYYKNGDTITLTVDLDAALYTVTADFSSFDNEYTAGDETVTDDGGGDYTVTYTISDNTTADGEYTIPVRAEDAAGNSTTDTSCSITLDNTAPAVTEPTADPSVIQPATATDVTFTASVSDGEGSGVDTVTVDLSSIGGAADQVMSEVDGIYEYVWAGLSVTDEDTYELVITATDTLGNENATANITLRVIADIEDPVIVSTDVEYPVGYESARPGDPVIITAVTTDALSGVETVTVDAQDIGLGAAVDMPLVAGTTDTYSSGSLTVDAGTAVGTYTLTVTATDYATNEATANATVEVTLVLTGYNIDLAEGWNLISLPLMPDDEDIDVILTDISDNVSQVRTWVYVDGVLTEKSWAEGGTVGDLTEMVDGQGYWIEMTEAKTLPIQGSELPGPGESMPVYDVYEGWNLIGFKSVSDVADAQDYLGGAVTLIFERMYGYDAEDDYYVTIQLTGNALEPGQGYWLAVSADGTIYP